MIKLIVLLVTLALAGFVGYWLGGTLPLAPALVLSLILGFLIGTCGVIVADYLEDAW